MGMARDRIWPRVVVVFPRGHRSIRTATGRAVGKQQSLSCPAGEAGEARSGLASEFLILQGLVKQ